MAADSIPVSNKLVMILHQRIQNALKVVHELNPSQVDIKNRIRESEDRVNTIDINQDPPSHDSFSLPDNDKLIIQYIQAIKKFRVLLRSEHSKGKIDTSTFANEDKQLSALQLRVNVETLSKRGMAALKTNMLGSARQYFEKAIAALDGQNPPDAYNQKRKASLQHKLQEIQDNLKNANAEDAAKKQEEERDELDELFAPKKKW